MGWPRFSRALQYPVNDSGTGRLGVHQCSCGRLENSVLPGLRFGRDRRLFYAFLSFHIEELKSAEAMNSLIAVAVVADVERGLFR